MKKARLILALLVVLAVCFGLAACKTAEYTLDNTTLSLEEGQTQQLTVISSLDNEFTVEYETSDLNVATVSASGLVTAVKAGTATITAKVDGKELTCEVTVTAKEPIVYEYTLSEKEITIVEGGYKNISVIVTPEKQISVTYTSANNEIATVNANGRVTAVAVGETTIKAAVDGKELICKVTVEKAPPIYTLAPIGSPLVEGGKTLIEKGSTLKFAVTSSDAEDKFEVVWSTSNDKIATVAQDGTVTAVANGDVTLTAKIGDVTKTCAVQVFTYQYTFEHTLSLAYGTTDAKLAVSVDHGKTLDISYVLENSDVVTIDENGGITIIGVGSVTVTIKDGEAEIGECVITVNAVFTANEQIQMHVGDELDWTVTANPADTQFTVVYAVELGNDVVSIDGNGKITALKNGEAKLTATIGDEVLRCDVLVDGVNATVTQASLTEKNVENLSGENIAYWENYIMNEVNFKGVASDEEDVINAVLSGSVGYLTDYAKLIWTDGSSDCAKPSKPDGWSEGATIGVSAPGQEGVKVTLKIDVIAGKTQIKVYTGVFKGTCTATLYNGETAIASYKMEDFEIMTRELLTFDVDAKENGEITIELVLTNAKADNSFITLAGVSVSGSTYQLAENNKRLAPEGTAAIVMNKNGEALTEGVTYEIIEGADVVSLENNVVTAIKLGTAKIAVTADGRTRIFTVEVGYAYGLDVDKVQLHKGGTHQINVVSDPIGGDIVAQYESTDQTIATVSDSGLITAVKNGTVIIKVRVDEKELELTVVISDVVVTASETTRLELDRDNPIDITEGAEYWEQYIANGEVNHKQYVTADEDIINKSSAATGSYLSDYKAFLAWHGGANGNTCSCGQCNKESQNGGDGGWTGGGTKAMSINAKDSVISLQFKLYAGESVIKIYTGGYNLVGRVQLKLGDQIIAEETFDNKGSHYSDMVEFTVDAVNACEVTAELAMINDYNDAGHSVISLAAASVSGSVYQLAKASERVAPNGTAQIVLNKDGVALTDGVTYEVVTEEGETALATVDNNGLVTAGDTNGIATIKVMADGRVRYFTVEIGYDYEIDQNSVTLKPNGSHQIVITSTPAGSTREITYTSGDETIATVDENGLITGVSNGSTTISAEVDGKQFTVEVTVSGIEVAVANETINNKYIELSAKDVIYWEYYLYNETQYKALADGEKDLIENTETVLTGNGGENNWNVGIYYDGSAGNKPNAYNEADKAIFKYSKGSLWAFNVTVPAGTHEIRVYTGAWETSANKISLLDGENSLASYTIPKTSGGISVLVTFTVELEEETTFKLRVEAVEGDNCRLGAISIADKALSTATDGAQITVEKKELQGPDSSSVNLSEIGTLDWVAYNIEIPDQGSGNIVSKINADYIGDTIKNGGKAWDYRAKFTWGEDGSILATECRDGNTDDRGLGEGYHDNLFMDNYYLSTTVKVDANVGKIMVYATGWKVVYNVIVRNAAGEVIVNEAIQTTNDGTSHAYEIQLNVTATDEEELTVIIAKAASSDGNVGVAAIAVAGKSVVIE